MPTSRRNLFAMAAGAAILPASAAMASETSTQRPVRRKDRMLSEAEAIEVIRHTEHATLATADASGQPYITPISPVYLDGALYFHCAADPKGRRYTNLLKNPKVSVCFVGRGETAVDELPDEFSVNYASAVVEGRAELVKDEAEKKRIALAIAGRHVPQAGAEKMAKYYEAGHKGIVVWKITVSSITGKARNKQGYFNRIKAA